MKNTKNINPNSLTCSRDKRLNFQDFAYSTLCAQIFLLHNMPTLEELYTFSPGFSDLQIAWTWIFYLGFTIKDVYLLTTLDEVSYLVSWYVHIL